MTVLLVLLTVPAVATAQSYKGKARVKGVVANSEGVGIKDAMVTAVWAESGEGPNAVKANGKGEFELKDLQPGMWSVTAAAGPLGWGADMAEVDVLARDTPEIALTLRPLQELASGAEQKSAAKMYAEARDLYLRMSTALPDMVVLHQPIAVLYAAEGLHPDAVTHYEILLEGLQAQAAAAAAGDASAGAVPPGAVDEIRLMAASSLASMANYDQMNTHLAAIEDGSYNAKTIESVVAIANNILMIEQEQFEQAVMVLDRAANKAPNSPVPYYYRGLAKVKLEALDEAKADLEKFVGMSPASSPLVARAKDTLESLTPAAAPQ